ncbi:hypothetical protein CMT57_00210 [Elizabethkingia anophelis]|uniref:type II toxin-antitoxin system Phd/YefM family antitoxin n=1 Tax=Elizabethkingia anophelis TaxID=1117645 RepID=UPI00201235EE|nr:type II toxin-antitoxin system Phd/YefM family antitoxin [Elizabethkingia anophelis]MCL1688366.1 type II toxin-antitoxin system Phd/YefM family antitoxin [Elizabethkingia anophelis]MDV4008259.1 hypothetical protein [Elizabethkingia anophelis]
MITVPLSRFRRSINKYADLAEKELVVVTINKRPVFVIKPVINSEMVKNNLIKGEDLIKN